MGVLYTTAAHFVTSAIVAALCVSASPVPPPAHSTHNPKHGGQFFPAAGDTLHVEGVWPQQRVFKLYVYDASSRPLSLERMRQVQASVDAAGQTFPMLLMSDGSAFMARVPPLGIPAQLVARVTMASASEPEGFSFNFYGFSDEHGLSFDVEPTIMPKTRRAIVAALRDDARDALSLLARQQSAYVFAPALHGRDHALGLEQFLPQLDAAARPRAQDAIRAVVRAAWLLHIAGDDGNNDQVRAAATQFQAAVADVALMFSGAAR
jgi:hypothetical protein